MAAGVAAACVLLEPAQRAAVQGLRWSVVVIEDGFERGELRVGDREWVAVQEPRDAAGARWGRERAVVVNMLQLFRDNVQISTLFL